MNDFGYLRILRGAAIATLTIAGEMSMRMSFAQEGVSGFPPPRAPAVLVPEAPSFSPADLEVDTFLQIPAARTTYEVTGKGLCVAVIDSGINTQHISFSGRLIKGMNFSEDGAASDMRDTGRDRPSDPITPNGHGSNVAGIIAGNKLPAFEGMPTGIAYDAKIIPLKVFPGGAFAKINASLQWVLDNREQVLADHGVLISVVNMSLGIPEDNRKDDSSITVSEIVAMRDLIKKLRNLNVAVVVSSGNSYATFAPNKQGMSIPGIFQEAVSVAAVYDTNLPANVPPLPRTYIDGGTVKQAVAGRMTVFSQRLSEAAGGVFRTDICAPGFFVTSAGPEVGADPSRSRTTQDGTSQAAPTVSGLILLAQQRWRNRMMAASPTSVGAKDLPTVDLLEKALRSGGVPFLDAEDSLAATMDNVQSCGDSFVRANAVGLLKQIDIATPSPTPSTPMTLQALQVELFNKSPEEQRRILGEFRKGTGLFKEFNKK